MNRQNTMAEIQKTVDKVLNKKPPRKKTQKEIFVLEKEKKTKPNKKSKTKLSDRSEKALKAHSKHHSKKHIDKMRKEMLAGVSFHPLTRKQWKQLGNE